MDVNQMPTDEFMALPEDQQEMLMRGQAMPDAPAQEAQEPAPETPAPPAEEAPAPAPEAAVQPERKGDPEVPLRQTREELRQTKERLAAYEAALQDPARVRAHLASISPGDAPDFDLDPQAALQHHLAPVVNELQQVKAELAQTQAQRAHDQMMGDLAGKYGSDFQTTLQDFDQRYPHLAASTHPEIRYLTALGERARQASPPDPAVEQERIKAAAQALLEQQLKSAKVPVQTLGNAPPTRPVGDEYDPNMSQEEFDRLTSAQVQAMGRNLGKK